MAPSPIICCAFSARYAHGMLIALVKSVRCIGSRWASLRKGIALAERQDLSASFTTSLSEKNFKKVNMSNIVSLRTEWASKESAIADAKRAIIIDDQSTARAIFDAIIRNIDGNMEVKQFANPLEAINWAKVNVPDLVLVDYKMQEIDGIETIRRLKCLPTCEDVPIIMVTISDDPRVRQEALDAGATDFLVKPFDPHECRARCRNLLALREAILLLKDRAKHLEVEVAAAIRAMRAGKRETVMLAANLSEYHAHQDGFRVIRIAEYAALIAKGLRLPPDRVECVELAAALLDIGKIGIADDILLADGDLTLGQEQALREHTQVGYRLLRYSSSEHLKMAAVIALYHHERYDGGGYPKGIKGVDIPLPARIVAVAEAFDQLTCASAYDHVDHVVAAMRDIRARKGTEFDPDCVEALASQLDKTTEIITAYGDPQ